MKDIPEDISRDDIIWAIKEIDSGRHRTPYIRESHEYCLEYTGRHFTHFPPKELIRHAHILVNGEELINFYGGKREANLFLQRRKFTIVPCTGRAPH